MVLGISIGTSSSTNDKNLNSEIETIYSYTDPTPIPMLPMIRISILRLKPRRVYRLAPAPHPTNDKNLNSEIET